MLHSQGSRFKPSVTSSQLPGAFLVFLQSLGKQSSFCLNLRSVPRQAALGQPGYPHTHGMLLSLSWFTFLALKLLTISASFAVPISLRVSQIFKNIFFCLWYLGNPIARHRWALLWSNPTSRLLDLTLTPAELPALGFCHGKPQATHPYTSCSSSIIEGLVCHLHHRMSPIKAPC